MSRYALSFAEGVKESIDVLPGHVRQRVKRTIGALRDNPYPPETVQMRDDLRDDRRIQIDTWRIVYTVDNEALLVEVVRVSRKSGSDRGPNFYRGLQP